MSNSFVKSEYRQLLLLWIWGDDKGNESGFI